MKSEHPLVSSLVTHTILWCLPVRAQSGWTAQASSERLVAWKEMSDPDAGVANGMYVYRMVADKFSAVKRMLLLK